MIGVSHHPLLFVIIIIIIIYNLVFLLDVRNLALKKYSPCWIQFGILRMCFDHSINANGEFHELYIVSGMCDT